MQSLPKAGAEKDEEEEEEEEAEEEEEEVEEEEPGLGEKQGMRPKVVW